MSISSPALNPQSNIIEKVSVAPMVGVTNHYFQYLISLISDQVLQYTEMMPVDAYLHGHRAPMHYASANCALQIAASSPEKITAFLQQASPLPFTEINLNAGCPSSNIQQCQSGAALMLQPDLVRQCLKAMIENTTAEVSLKTRIGVDNLDSYSYLSDYMEQVLASGCRKIILHARKVILKGLSPRQNRTIPPLHYETVYRVKADFPEAKIIINGGINTVEDIKEHLHHVDGVMIGRKIWKEPLFLQQLVPGSVEVKSKLKICSKYLAYLLDQHRQGKNCLPALGYLMGLFHGERQARQTRQKICDLMSRLRK